MFLLDAAQAVHMKYVRRSTHVCVLMCIVYVRGSLCNLYGGVRTLHHTPTPTLSDTSLRTRQRTLKHTERHTFLPTLPLFLSLSGFGYINAKPNMMHSMQMSCAKLFRELFLCRLWNYFISGLPCTQTLTPVPLPFPLRVVSRLFLMTEWRGAGGFSVLVWMIALRMRASQSHRFA